MRIGYKPQRLLNNLVSEQFFNNGNALQRVIEIPTGKPRTLEVIYKKTDFMPTEWYVANYTVRNRDKNSSIAQTMNTDRTRPNKSRTIIQRYNKYNNPEMLTIDVLNGKIHRKKELINSFK